MFRPKNILKYCCFLNTDVSFFNFSCKRHFYWKLKLGDKNLKVSNSFVWHCILRRIPKWYHLIISRFFTVKNNLIINSTPWWLRFSFFLCVFLVFNYFILINDLKILFISFFILFTIMFLCSKLVFKFTFFINRFWLIKL